MRRAGTNKVVMMLDEIDKLGAGGLMATRAARCWKCWIRSRTTNSATTTWVSISTCRT